MSVIDKVENALLGLAFADVQKCSDGGAKMGAFILLSCLIDAAVGFWVGRDTKGKDYKDFVKKYMPSYDAEALYADLRCKLVHSYSEGGTYAFTDGNSQLHFANSEMLGVAKTINLEDFMGDVKDGIEALIRDARNNTSIGQNFDRRYNDNGVLVIQDKFVCDVDSGTTQVVELTGNWH